MIQVAVGAAPWFGLIPLVWANLRVRDASAMSARGDRDAA
ncbi:MAG: hypothetical protein JWN61_291 [Pseudonocardiales bacterium]|nr:hypothetical protein [Jatrophihabitantaceae bacterium]MCW2602156.1 hypothetical protein [Pseudonocardiales bacterium]